MNFLGGVAVCYLMTGIWVASLNWLSLRAYFQAETSITLAWLTSVAIWPVDVARALRVKRELVERETYKRAAHTAGELFPGE